MRDLPDLSMPGFRTADFLRDAFGFSFFKEADLATRFLGTPAPSDELFLACLFFSLAFKGRFFVLTSCDFLPAAVRAIVKEDKSDYVSSTEDTGTSRERRLASDRSIGNGVRAKRWHAVTEFSELRLVVLD